MIARLWLPLPITHWAAMLRRSARARARMTRAAYWRPRSRRSPREGLKSCLRLGRARTLAAPLLAKGANAIGLPAIVDPHICKVESNRSHENVICTGAECRAPNLAAASRRKVGFRRVRRSRRSRCRMGRYRTPPAWGPLFETRFQRGRLPHGASPVRHRGRPVDSRGIRASV
jgi:hypothetical protein